MEETLHLGICSAKAVGTVLLVSLAGVGLMRMKVIGDDSLKVLSKAVFSMMLPCLFFAKMAERVDIQALKELWAVPLCAGLFIGGGLISGWLAAKLCGAKEEFLKASVAASAFGNSSFIPIPLVMAVALSFPMLGAGKVSLGISYVSLYLLMDTLLFWSIAYALLSDGKLKGIKVKDILNPPMIGLLLGMLVGAFPQLKSLLVGNGAPLSPLYDAAGIVGSASIPCALIVLGGRLAYGPSSKSVRKRLVTGVIVAKLILMPLLAFVIVKLLVWAGAIPHDPLLATVLVVQAAVPPAATISVLCALRNPAIESDMANLMFWSYLVSVPTLTVFIVLSMRTFA